MTQPSRWPISFFIAAALAWAGIGAAELTDARGEKPAQPALEAFRRYAPDLFEQRWQNWEAVEPAAKKHDRLALYTPEPQPVAVQHVAMKTRHIGPAAPKKSLREGPCAKGKRWITKRGGWRTWRCRR